MKIRRFNENMSYTNIFGVTITHEESLKEDVKGEILHIITEELKISEKDFDRIDDILMMLDEKLTVDILTICDSLYNEGKRMRYIAEIIFDDYFKNMM